MTVLSLCLQHYDDKVDIWSIGALLYKVIVGTCGFYAVSYYHMMSSSIANYHWLLRYSITGYDMYDTLIFVITRVIL